MELPKRRILMNVFFKAQFNHCPIIWMFHSRCLHNKIVRLHEGCLRMIYHDKISNFEELLNKVNSVSIHHNNMHALAFEMCKVANDMSPDIMNEIFKLRNNPHYNLRHASHFSTDPIHSVYYGTESGAYLRPKMWEQIPAEIKIRNLLMVLRKKLKNGNILSVHVEFVQNIKISRFDSFTLRSGIDGGVLNKRGRKKS